jgi:hypothetical protein
MKEKILERNQRMPSPFCAKFVPCKLLESLIALLPPTFFALVTIALGAFSRPSAASTQGQLRRPGWRKICQRDLFYQPLFGWNYDRLLPLRFDEDLPAYISYFSRRIFL